MACFEVFAEPWPTRTVNPLNPKHFSNVNCALTAVMLVIN